MSAARYITHAHFERRCRERGFSIFDARRVFETCTACDSFTPERIFAGGTAWRLTGLDTDGNLAMVGVEAFRDNLGRRVLLVTIMDGGR